MRTGEQKTIVSVTPIAVERDSRTFKEAASFTRLGHRSIVVEGEASARPADGLPFELITQAGAEPSWGSTAAPGGEDAAPETEPLPAGALARAGRKVGRALLPVSGPLWHLRENGRWSRNVYRSLPPADLYVLHSFRQYPAVRYACLRHRARYVYDAHDAYFEMRPDQRGDNERVWAALERRCVRGASGFLTVSDGLADVLERRHKRRPAVIRNCQDLRLDRIAETGLRNAIGLPASAFLVVVVGNDKPGMTVPVALDALRSLPEHVHLACVGRGHERHAARARELGLGDRVHLPGSAPPTEVPSFIGSADAALLAYRPLTANYASGLPNGFFQSIAAGLPVLYPHALVEVAALARRHELGLDIDAEDPDSIAAGIRRLAEEPELRKTLAAGSQRAREAESWEREENRLAGCIEGLL